MTRFPELVDSLRGQAQQQVQAVAVFKLAAQASRDGARQAADAA